MTALLSVVLSSGLLVGQDPALVLPQPTPYLQQPPPMYPITIWDFAHTVKPDAGKYQVLFVHPVKCCPVLVCFTLPPGCPCVSAGKRTLTFDYGSCAVTIRFKILGGGVKVTYD